MLRHRTWFVTLQPVRTTILGRTSGDRLSDTGVEKSHANRTDLFSDPVLAGVTRCLGFASRQPRAHWNTYACRRGLLATVSCRVRNKDDGPAARPVGTPKPRPVTTAKAQRRTPQLIPSAATTGDAAPPRTVFFLDTPSRASVKTPILTAACLLILAVIAGVSPAPARAQSRAKPDERAVRAVLDSFYTAVGAQHYDSAAAFVIFEPFARYFHQQIGNLRSAIPHRWSVEEYMATDTTMPRIVAEWQVQQLNKRANDDPFLYYGHEYARITSAAELVALDPHDALARWIEAKDPRYRMIEAWKRSNCSALSPLPPPESMPRQVVKGVAFSDDTTAYAIVDDGRELGDDVAMYMTHRVL